MFILKVVKVLCFDTLSQVFILKALTGVAFCIANPKKQFSRSARDDNFCVEFRLGDGMLPGKGWEERASRAGCREQAEAPIS